MKLPNRPSRAPLSRAEDGNAVPGIGELFPLCFDILRAGESLGSRSMSRFWRSS